MSATFESLGLSPESLATLRRARFEAPTPIQSQAIPPALAGRDVIGCAATGTGKTAAFLLPLMERFRGQEGTLGLVLAPTRELVMQIAEQARFFGEEHGLRHAVVIGGEDMNLQVEALRQQPTFILATPGRLVDLLASKAVNLSKVQGLVLDEADRMLDMGFQQQLETILEAVPKQHQTLLFSATLGHDVTEFAQRQLRKPVKVEVTPSGTPAPRAVQKLYAVAQDEKYAMLLTLLARDQASVLVFAATKQRADKVLKALKREGYKAAAIHSDRTQNQRKQALDGFAKGQYRCLVATDIAARGLDVEDIGHVINFDLPHAPEDYVHRIGRTARLGAEGDAISFACERYAQSLPDIEAYIEQKIPVEPITADLLVSLPRKPREGVEAMADDGESVSAIFREAREARAAEEQRRGGGRSGGGGRGSSHGGRSAGGEGRRERTPRPPRAIEAAVQAPKPAAPVAAAPVAAAPVAANAVAAADGERAPRKRRRRRGGKRIEGAEAAAIPQQAKGPSEVVATRVAPRPAAARSGTDKAGASGEPSLLSRIGRGLKSLVTRAPRSQH